MTKMLGPKCVGVKMLQNSCTTCLVIKRVRGAYSPNHAVVCQSGESGFGLTTTARQFGQNYSHETIFAHTFSR